MSFPFPLAFWEFMRKNNGIIRANQFSLKLYKSNINQIKN